MTVLTYIVGWLIAIVAIVVGATTPSKWLIAFGIASLLSVTWVAFWRRPGETYFDLETRTLWAKFTHLAESATIPIIAVYIIAFVIAALIN
jgi:hypothetical protein